MSHVTIIAYYLLNLQNIPCSDLMILQIFRYMVIPEYWYRNADDSQTILEYVVLEYVVTLHTDFYPKIWLS